MAGRSRGWVLCLTLTTSIGLEWKGLVVFKSSVMQKSGVRLFEIGFFCPSLCYSASSLPDLLEPITSLALGSLNLLIFGELTWSESNLVAAQRLMEVMNVLDPIAQCH